MKQFLKLKLSQKLSPQQIQLMKLIQLPTLDFEQKIQREIEENPALEQGQNSSDENITGTLKVLGANGLLYIIINLG